MGFDPRAVFANLAEKEKIKGHHSPEGRAIRTLSRALSGWAANNLSASDVMILCDQAVEDWLKARLRVSAWSSRGLPDLLTMAVESELITRSDGVRLQRVRNTRTRLRSGGSRIAVAEAEAALEFCIELVEKHW